MSMPWGFVPQTDWRKEEMKREIRMAANRCGIILLLMLVLMYLIPFGLSTLIGYAKTTLLQINDSAVLWNELFSLICYILIYLVTVPLLLFVMNRFSGTRTADWLRFPKMPAKNFWKLILMGFGVVYPSAYVGNILYQAFAELFSHLGIPMNSLSSTVDRNIISVAVLVMSVVVLAPFFEELLMRCGMVGLVKKHGCWFTAISTGILFGFLHTNFEQVYFAAMMGIYAGFVAYKTRSVWPTIILHMAVNGLSALTSILISFTGYDAFLNSLLEGARPSLYAGGENIVVNLIGILAIMLINILIWVLAICGAVTIVREIGRHPREYHPKEQSEQILSLPEKLRTFFTAPGVIIFLVISILLSCMNAFVIV